MQQQWMAITDSLFEFNLHSGGASKNRQTVRGGEWRPRHKTVDLNASMSINISMLLKETYNSHDPEDFDIGKAIKRRGQKGDC